MTVLRFTICSFLDEVALGAEFDADELPLHVTLLGDARTEADLAQLEGAVERALAGFGGLRAVAGDDELDGDLEVTVLDEADDFESAHRELVAELRELDVRVVHPEQVGRGYRARVAVTDADRIDRDDDVEVRAVAIVDLAPDGDAGRRRVVAQFPLI